MKRTFKSSDREDTFKGMWITFSKWYFMDIWIERILEVLKNTMYSLKLPGFSLSKLKGNGMPRGFK